jgi:ATP-dependent RNA helicase DeaD
VAAHDRARLVGEVSAAVGAARDVEVTAMAEKLVADHDAVAVVALLVERALAGRPAGEKLTRVELRAPSHPRSQGPARSPAPGGKRPPSGDMVTFEVNLGAKDRAEANWILPLVCRRGGITRRDVGAIRVARDRTYFEVARAAADEFAANAAERDPRAPHVRIVASASPLPPRSFTPPPPRGKQRRP